MHILNGALNRNKGKSDLYLRKEICSFHVNEFQKVIKTLHLLMQFH